MDPDFPVSLCITVRENVTHNVFVWCSQNFFLYVDWCLEGNDVCSF